MSVTQEQIQEALEKIKTIVESIDMEQVDAELENHLNILKVTNSNGLSFNVRIVRKGDTYGRNNCLTHDEDKALVEFYDTRFPHTSLGQFVSRYYADTMLNRGPRALDLDSGIPSWTIDDDAMTVVHRWLNYGLTWEDLGIME